MSGPTHAVVRVKVARNVFTSPLMPLDEAKAAAEQFRRDVVECGGSWWFVKFAGYDGREVQIRGRDVVAIEYVPDLPDRIRPPAGDAQFSLDAGRDSDGTMHLRSIAGLPPRGQR